MSKNEKYGNGLRYAGLATQLMALMAVSVWGGMKLDEWIGWKFPVLLISLPVIALCLSLWQLIKEFNKPKK